MDIYSKFKPNLIPNSDVSNPIDLKSIVGNRSSDYIASFKKDGCRVEFVKGKILSRALKPVTSLWIQQRYQKLAEKCKELDIILEGEFYAHGYRFNEIVRYFKTKDVTDQKHVEKLLEAKTQYNFMGDPSYPIFDVPSSLEEENLWRSQGLVSKFEEDWPGRSVEWLSTYHDELKVWPFDVLLLNYPEMDYYTRMKWLFSHIIDPNGLLHEFKDILEVGDWYNIPVPDGLGAQTLTTIGTFSAIEDLYEHALNSGYEGLVLANKNRTYKFNRSTEKDNHLFKMKEDKNEYDGEILDILEGTVVKEGVPKTVNELGRSVTSKLQEDREPSGMAKGILTTYNGYELTVSLEGFDHDELREFLANKKDYIGKWIKYTGMAPTKNVPRHAHFSKGNWRDDK